MALVEFKFKPGIDKQQQKLVQKTVGLILIIQDLDMVYQKK